MRRVPTILFLAASFAAAGCSGSDDTTTAPGTEPEKPPPPPEPDLSHTFPPITIGPGDEITSLCQSWTVGNDTPLFVNWVRTVNDGGWHHSNWFFVTDDQYDGPDGTWPCSERNFSQVGAGVSGGVFFAQSTQALGEEQKFAEGVAIHVPANARIIGNVHLLNTTPDSMDSSLSFDVNVIEPEDVVIELSPMTFTNMALAIPPRQRSVHEMDCEFQSAADFNIHYVLPHYHELGEEFTLHLTGGDRDGELFFENRAPTGEAWGQVFDPPISMAGALGARLTCGFDNTFDKEIGYGVGDQEMCIFLAFTDSKKKFAGVSLSNVSVGETNAEGLHRNVGGCLMIETPPE